VNLAGISGVSVINSANSISIAHNNTSSQSSVNNSNGTVIQDVTLDEYGHVSELGSVNLDSRYLATTGKAADSEKLDGLDSSQFLRSDANDTASGDITFEGTLTFNGVTNGIYHSVEEDHYYFDDYNGSRNIQAFLKTQRSDIIKYRPISNIEYWNGSSWLDGSSQLDNIKRLLDGREDTAWSVPSTYYKFRFTVNASTGWPTRALIGAQLSWSGSSFPGYTLTVEEQQADSSWQTKVTANFTSANGITNWGTSVLADFALHTGRTNTRITVDFYGWNPSNPSYTTIPLKNIFIYSNYSGSENNDYHNLFDYDRNIVLPNTVKASNIGAGTDNSVVVLDSAGYLRTDEIDSRVWGSSLVDGNGTANSITKWSDSNTLTNSSISDNGSTVTIASNTSITSAGITTNGYLRGPASFVIDPSAHGNDTGTVVIAGNLQVDGTTTTINSTTLTIDDLNIVVASDAGTSSAAHGAGLTINGAGATFQWNNTNSRLEVNKTFHSSGNVVGNILISSNSNGIEGGELQLAKPATSSTLAGAVVIFDIYGNALRIFENGGNYRGARLDIAGCANSNESRIIHSNPIAGTNQVYKMVSLTESDYNGITTKDANTLYIIV
jgi:hypothetical protein